MFLQLIYTFSLFSSSSDHVSFSEQIYVVKIFSFSLLSLSSFRLGTEEGEEVFKR